MGSFQLFTESRQHADFQSGVDMLCESLAVSGVPFDQFWLYCGLPTLLESNCQTEQELLNEFWGGLKDFLGNPGRQMRQSSLKRPPGPTPTPQWILDHDKQARQEDEQVTAYRSKLEQSIKEIRTAFTRAMTGFLHQAQQAAEKNNDYMSYRMAEKFHDALIKAAEPNMNKWTDQLLQSVKMGQRSPEQHQHQADFDQRVSASKPSMDQRLSALPPEKLQQLAVKYAQVMGTSPNVIQGYWQRGITDPKAIKADLAQQTSYSIEGDPQSQPQNQSQTTYGVNQQPPKPPQGQNMWMPGQQARTGV